MQQEINDQKFLIIMMNEEDYNEFYEQLYASLNKDVIARIYCGDCASTEQLTNMIKEVVSGSRDIIPALVYYDHGYEKVGTSPSEATMVASISSLITGNIATSIDYEHADESSKAKRVYKFGIDNEYKKDRV